MAGLSYRTCPKCGHTRAEDSAAAPERCPACGIVYAKWLRSRLAQAAPEPVATGRRRAGFAGLGSGLRTRLLQSGTPAGPAALWARAALLLALVVWGWQFILMDHAQLHGGLPEINASFMHRVNLVFHEAGHVLFIPFGRFMTVLGGSLGQLLMPALVIGVFLWRQQDPFAAAVGLWWLAQSTMDLAPYIHDARAGEMILLGGVTGSDRPGYHDWTNLLGWTGLLEQDHAIAAAVDGAGTVLMVLAWLWGAAALYAQRGGGRAGLP